MKTNTSCVYTNAITYNAHLNTLEPRRTYKRVLFELGVYMMLLGVNLEL